MSNTPSQKSKAPPPLATHYHFYVSFQAEDSINALVTHIEAGSTVARASVYKELEYISKKMAAKHGGQGYKLFLFGPSVLLSELPLSAQATAAVILNTQAEKTKKKDEKVPDIKAADVQIETRSNPSETSKECFARMVLELMPIEKKPTNCRVAIIENHRRNITASIYLDQKYFGPFVMDTHQKDTELGFLQAMAMYSNELRQTSLTSV